MQHAVDAAEAAQHLVARGPQRGELAGVRAQVERAWAVRGERVQAGLDARVGRGTAEPDDLRAMVLHQRLAPRAAHPAGPADHHVDAALAIRGQRLGLRHQRHALAAIPLAAAIQPRVAVRVERQLEHLLQRHLASRVEIDHAYRPVRIFARERAEQAVQAGLGRLHRVVRVDAVGTRGEQGPVQRMLVAASGQQRLDQPEHAQYAERLTRQQRVLLARHGGCGVADPYHLIEVAQRGQPRDQRVAALVGHERERLQLGIEAPQRVDERRFGADHEQPAHLPRGGRQRCHVPHRLQQHREGRAVGDGVRALRRRGSRQRAAACGGCRVRTVVGARSRREDPRAVAAQARARRARLVAQLDVELLPAGARLVQADRRPQGAHARRQHVEPAQRERQRGAVLAHQQRDRCLNRGIQQGRMQHHAVRLRAGRLHQPRQREAGAGAHRVDRAQARAVIDTHRADRVVAALARDRRARATRLPRGQIERGRLGRAGLHEALGIDELGVAGRAHAEFVAARRIGQQIDLDLGHRLARHERPYPHHVGYLDAGLLAGDGRERGARQLQRDDARHDGAPLHDVIDDEELAPAEAGAQRRPATADGARREPRMCARRRRRGRYCGRYHGRGRQRARFDRTRIGRQRHGRRIEPVALACERIGRQRHAPIAAIGVQGAPLRLGALQIGVGQRAERGAVFDLGACGGECRCLLLPGARRRRTGRGRRISARLAVHLAARIERGAERRRQFDQIAHHPGRAAAEVLAARQQREAEVAEVERRLAQAVRTQAFDLLAQLAGRAGRQRDQPRRPVGMAQRAVRRLADHQMRVGAARAERADGGQPRPLRLARPWQQPGIDVERAVGEADRGIAAAVVQRRRDLLVLEREQDLQHARHAGRVLGVTEIGLQRADRAVFAALGVGAERARERAELDRVAEPGAGAVRLDHADLAGVDAEALVDAAQQRLLRARAGRRDAVGGAVLVDARATDHAVNVIAVGQRVGKPLEHQHAHALARHEAVGAGVEGVAAAGGRQHAGAMGGRVELRRGLQEHAARQRHARLAAAQVLAGEIDRDERAGAGAVDRHRRALQVQVVGDPRRDHRGHVAPQRLRRRLAEEQILVIAAAAADVDAAIGAGHLSAGVAGVLQRLPGFLQEMPLLRIHVGRLEPRDVEEQRVEFRDALHEAAVTAGGLAGVGR